MNDSPTTNIGVNQTTLRWPGSGSYPVVTPFSFYTDEQSFQTDCYNSAIWAAKRLGYPEIDIELTDGNFYTCFEEGVTEYAAQVNQYNIVNNFLSLVGQSTNKSLNGLPINASGLNYSVKLAQDYGSAVGVGGYVDVKKGYIDAKTGQQNYDLQCLWGNVSESFNRIEIRRIFNQMPPAFARIYDPFSMTGMSYSNVLNEMGFAGYSPATQFLMTPIFEDLLRGQAIEFNDMVRKSAYSFEVRNNKLKLFPIPVRDFRMYFEYVVENDKNNNIIDPTLTPYSQASDLSNVPYENIPYSKINSVGKQWIKKYYLALCKEVLGAVRQKYSTVPIPGGEVTLDGAELRGESEKEKESLITQLREILDATNPSKQMEAFATRAEKQQEMLRKAPIGTVIYIG